MASYFVNIQSHSATTTLTASVPEYARAYIDNLPGPDKLAGFYMGPDGTIWGRDFLGADPETPRPLLRRHCHRAV